MPTVRPFRFGLQVMGQSTDDLRRTAAAAEAAGFDVLSTFDHLGPHWPPLAPLLAAALWTERLRVCPLVLCNDFHHPALLARELAAMDLLSGGRVEAGLGAGHAFLEYASIGRVMDPPAVRKARLVESVTVLRRLLDGESVKHEGEHYRLHEARILPPAQPHLPILVAVDGRRALEQTLPHADIIGLSMLGRTLSDGVSHEPRWQSARLDERVAWIRQAAEGGEGPELNALVQRVRITEDRRGAAREILTRYPNLDLADVLQTPFLAIGTHDEVAEHLRRCRERWGISYFTVRDLAGFAPVISRLRGSSGV